MNNDGRPDPDALLEKVQRDEAQATRGKLKVFFGACPGVGKTYAMLNAARILRNQGVDVVVGIVETHGRSETAHLLEGLEYLPPKMVNYQGRELREFDLDAALARRPALMLVDELAHSNLAGSRHPKRWQDVEELLAAGIDVYTTVNVQHLESLNDIVGGITGIIVRETLPDRIFEQADDVTLVDLPADELLQRMKEGKVYLPQQAESAIRNFFRKGNLIALRELALRRTADRVDAQMREYRADQSISQVWQAKERLMVCVGPGEDSSRLVRSAARLAASLHADWLAVYVETPKLLRLSEARRDRVFKTLRLAQELGAETTSLSGAELAPTLLGYAQERNVSKLVIGKSSRSMLARLLRPSPADQLASQIDMDVYIVGHDPEQSAHEPAFPTLGLGSAAPTREKQAGYAWAVVACAVTTLATAGLVNVFDLANVIMLYLLVVVLISIRFGRGPGIFASLLSVGAFDFFFVDPRLSFTVADTQYLFTFALMLVVTLVISNLTASLHYQARVARYRERRAEALFEAGKVLSSALTAGQIIREGSSRLAGIFQSQVAILLPDSHDELLHLFESDHGSSFLAELDLGVAQWAYDHQEPAGLGTHTLPANRVLYQPLRAPMRVRGVLAIRPSDPHLIFQPEQQRLLETFASQIALALERVHYVEVAQDALVNMEAERLRNSLLSAISHDLRTPLTGLLGLSAALAARPQDSVGTELVHAIHDQALRINALVINLLDMARLQAGGVTLNKHWQPIEEVIGSALRACSELLVTHQVETHLPRDLPLVAFDAMMIERVLCNLLDNAAKYTPVGTPIVVSAALRGEALKVSVADEGPGLPEGMEERIFDKFTRGERESSRPGVGLGLAICRAIVQAHGGRIRAENRAEGGAIFSFTLPLGTPPEVSAADAETEEI
ncbi:MAG: two-component system sensor histidine kinase KdbD [Gammaproteobacteria bacterium 28-57-27]|nr:MAG: two-component system sensor histidine kinase KdbD [Gammaproteobacteria bacterium 28-57-27]